MANSDFSIALRNYAGVPVVELVGKVTNTTIASLNQILNRLAQAGHYNVMVNLKRAAWENMKVFSSLEKAAEVFQKHYGYLDVIAEATQIASLLESHRLSQVLRFCTSEGQALTRIKRIPGPSALDPVAMQAHLAES
ncbi:MAG: hypothetical protein K6U00_09860 [Armatimonadetes bacterium]|nr:hypothetical protein [Armatimonadota bacterium]